MKGFYEVLPYFYDGFEIINYETCTRYELVDNPYGVHPYIRETSQDGCTNVYKHVGDVFTSSVRSSTHWGVGVKF